MIKKVNKNQLRKKRHFRVRRKIHGTETRPRLNVFRSNRAIYTQIIDDSKGITLVSASTVDLKLKGNNIDNCQKVGEEIGKRALDKGIKEVVFDRGGYVYHGKVKALAEAARDAGLKI